MNRENKRKQYEKGYYKTHPCTDSFTCKVCGRPVRARFVLAAQPQTEPKSPVDEGALFAAFGRENVDIVD